MTGQSGLSVGLHDLLRQRVLTFEELDVLFLLRERRAEWLTVREVSQASGISADEAHEALDHLRASNLVEAGTGYHFRPGTDLLAERVDELAAAWKHSRLAVMKVVSANALERVRTQGMRAFADVFLLGQRKKDDG